MTWDEVAERIAAMTPDQRKEQVSVRLAGTEDTESGEDEFFAVTDVSFVDLHSEQGVVAHPQLEIEEN